jgi:hypothetical protein
LTDPIPRKRYFWGIVALVFGFLFGAIGILQAFRIVYDFVLNSPLDIWLVAGQIWIFGLAIYLIFVGLRKPSRANIAQQTTMSRIGWGRVLIGTFVAYATLMGHFRPSPNRYQLEPSNETQAEAMKAMEVFLTVSVPIAGIILAAVGVRKGFKQLDKPDPDVDTASPNASS